MINFKTLLAWASGDAPSLFIICHLHEMLNVLCSQGMVYFFTLSYSNKTSKFINVKQKLLRRYPFRLIYKDCNLDHFGFDASSSYIWSYLMN
jgi:hypothetical protein